MFKNKLFLVAYAITQAEGWFYKGENSASPQGSASYSNHNPGNLRSSVFQANVNNGFAVFENDLVGFYAIVNQLYIYASGRSSAVAASDTIEKATSVYNGLQITDPDFEGYISIIEKVAGVDRSQPISTLIT